MKKGFVKKGGAVVIIILFLGASTGMCMIDSPENEDAYSASGQTEVCSDSQQDAECSILDDLVWQWAVSGGGPAFDWSYHIEVDTDGNAYIAGYFNETAMFGNTTLTGQGIYDGFVAKLDAEGTWQWAVSVGGECSEVTDLSLDSNGNVYVIGTFFNTATFGNISLIGQGFEDIFVAELNTSGVWQWMENAGGPKSDSGDGITVNDAGDIYVTGSFESTAIFDTITLLAQGYYSDIFIAKLNTAGEWQWVKSAGGEIEYDKGTSIAVDGNGYVYVTGYFEGPATFGNVTLSGYGEHDIFISKLSTDGIWQWTTSAGGSEYDIPKSIITDENGYIYLTGSCSFTTYFGTITLTDCYVFIAKLTMNGVWQWVKGGAGFFIGAKDIALDLEGNIQVVGDYQVQARFGSVTLYSLSYWDVFVLKFSPSGVCIGATNAGGKSDDRGSGIAIDTQGNIYIVGCFDGTATFGRSVISSHGYFDIYVAKTNASLSNRPPDVPCTPSGPASGRVGVNYLFNTSAIDPDGDFVYYVWSWGDGTISYYYGPYASGANASANHTWTKKGTYDIRVLARDPSRDGSWSDPMPITMPCSYDTPFTNLLMRLLEQFPNAFPILRYLLDFNWLSIVVVPINAGSNSFSCTKRLIS